MQKEERLFDETRRQGTLQPAAVHFKIIMSSNVHSCINHMWIAGAVHSAAGTGADMFVERRAEFYASGWVDEVVSGDEYSEVSPLRIDLLASTPCECTCFCFG